MIDVVAIASPKFKDPTCESLRMDLLLESIKILNRISLFHDNDRSGSFGNYPELGRGNARS
jgi:hypothetical protein